MCGFAFGCHAQARPKMETTTAVWTRWWCRKARDGRVVRHRGRVRDRVRVGSVIRRRLRECVGDDTAGLSIGRYACVSELCVAYICMYDNVGRVDHRQCHHVE